jgi:hypothetical protein
VYGYDRLKEMMQEGEYRGYFSLGRNDKEIVYLILEGKEDLN